MRARAMLKKKLQACCRFEFDRLGQVIGYERRQLLCCQDRASPPRKCHIISDTFAGRNLALRVAGRVLRSRVS